MFSLNLLIRFEVVSGHRLKIITRPMEPTTEELQELLNDNTNHAPHKVSSVTLLGHRHGDATDVYVSEVVLVYIVVHLFIYHMMQYMVENGVQLLLPNSTVFVFQKEISNITLRYYKLKLHNQ